MRRRSTFVHSPSYEFDPSTIQLKTRQLLHPGIKAAREERLTFGFDELPAELVSLFEQSHELHIRWSPESSPGSIPPFSSRLTPGLHVHYTPLVQPASPLLCRLMKTAFSHDLKCQSPDINFSRPDVLSDRFTSTAARQFYSLLPSLNQFVAYIQTNICSTSDQQCIHDAGLLNIVDFLDLDYDSISHALTLTAFWSRAPPAVYDPIGGLTTLDQWPLDISSREDNKVEVGVLSTAPAIDAHEIQLGGFLTVVGEDTKPRATQFSFPSRHHILSAAQAAKQAYTVSFQTPTGLHPTLEISFPSSISLAEPSNKPEYSSCALHAYLTLPSSIFADEYAFTSDPLFEQSHNLRSLRSISGELDLEAPDYVVEKWGSAMLLELATPPEDLTASTGIDRSWNVTIPLHLRYQPPASGGLDEIQVPWPVVFWACTAEDGTKFPVNPFDRVNLGYDGLFGTRTMFYHLKPAPRGEDGSIVESIKVPVLDARRVGGDIVVERVTLVVILLGFGWVLFKLWPGLIRIFGFGAEIKKEAETKKKQ